MPAYNCEDYVAASIESVLGRDYGNLELLVVDDGSSDRTPQIAQSYGSRVRLIEQENGGAAAARNLGLKTARGEYISFLDSDDIWHPEKLSSQFAYIDSHPEVGLVFSGWQEWLPDDSGEWSIPEGFLQNRTRSTPDPDASGWIYSKLLLDCAMHTITVLIRKSVVEEVGYMKADLVNGEDYDYWLRVSRLCEIHKLQDVVALYRIRPGSLVRQVHERNYEYEVLENALRTWGRKAPDGSGVSGTKLRQRIARLWLDFAYNHYHEGDTRLAIDAAKHVIRARPFWPAGWKYLLVSSLKYRFN